MPATDALPALEIADLRFRRPDGFTLAVDAFRLDSGEACLLTGPSGCGKSTLLLLAAGGVFVVVGRLVALEAARVGRG